jgi:hypothetical protein
LGYEKPNTFLNPTTKEPQHQPNTAHTHALTHAAARTTAAPLQLTTRSTVHLSCLPCPLSLRSQP